MDSSLTQEEIAKKLKEREINISQQTISRYLNKEKIIPKIDQFVKKLDTKEKQVK
jgi:arginine repressor